MRLSANEIIREVIFEKLSRLAICVDDNYSAGLLGVAAYFINLGKNII